MRTLKPWMATAVAVAALIAPAAQAQTKKELVAKIVALQKPQFEGFGQNLAQAPLQQMMPQVAQAVQRLPEDKRAGVAQQIDAEVRKYLEAVSPPLRNGASKVASDMLRTKLEAEYSEEELKLIVSTLESPVMKRFSQSIGPEQLQQIAQKLSTDNRPMLEARVKGLQERLLELLGQKPPASAPAPAGK
jgi:uncharacterized protein